MWQSLLLLWFLVNILSLQVNFEDEARIKFLKLLGFSKDDIEKKVFYTWCTMWIGFPNIHPMESLLNLLQISKCLGKSFYPNGYGVDAKDLAEKMQQLTTEVNNPREINRFCLSCSFSFYLIPFPESWRSCRCSDLRFCFTLGLL